MGRFISADNYPSTGQGLLGNNMFAYCNNSPLNFTDSDGKHPRSEQQAIFAALLLGAASVALLSAPHETPEDIDWDNSDKNHIMKGTGSSHHSGWNKFGFDPKDPNNWSKVVAIMTGIIAKDNLVKVADAKGGTGTLYYYAKSFVEISVRVVVKIWVSADGLVQKISDAIPFIE